MNRTPIYFYTEIVSTEPSYLQVFLFYIVWVFGILILTVIFRHILRTYIKNKIIKEHAE